MDLLLEIRWRPGIGDPSFMGWLTVAAYAVVAFLAWLAGRRAGRASGTHPGGRMMWWLVSAFMMMLCVNKQLDLQSLLTDIGRMIAWKQGWYGERREVQKWFVFAIVGIAGLVSLFFLIRYHRFWREHPLLVTGLGFLTTFILVRAVSFHHVDIFLRSRVGGLKFNWILELGGIGLVGLAALLGYQNPAARTKRLAPGFIRH